MWTPCSKLAWVYYWFSSSRHTSFWVSRTPSCPCRHSLSPLSDLFFVLTSCRIRNKSTDAHSMREGSLPLNTAFSGSQPLAQNTAGTLRPYCRPTLPIVRTFPLVLIGQESRVFTWRKLTPDFLQKYTKETIKDVAGRPHKYSGSCLRRII